MAVRKTVSLRTTFLQFALVLVLCITAAVAIPYLLLSISVNLGWATYANNSEIMAQEAVPQLIIAPAFSEELVPQGSRYLLLDKTFNKLQTNMSEGDLETALAYVRGKAINPGSNHRFLLITRDNEYVVLKYYIGSQYTNPSLNGRIPSPEILLIILIILFVLLACILSTSLFARRLRRQMEPLYQAARQVGKQNLDFEVGQSSIQEYNEVLRSFSEMKDKLKIAMQEQWAAEQRQREQIAALSHDLKTPLTVVMGNADLLLETNLSQEQNSYVSSMLQGAESMEYSIETLIDVSRASGGYDLELSDVAVIDFFQNTLELVAPLAKLKGVRLETHTNQAPSVACFDPALIKLALLNIITNAIEFSPRGGVVFVHAVKSIDNGLCVRISDTGSGFSKESLAKATQRFYMGDSSRTERKCLGMNR